MDVNPFEADDAITPVAIGDLVQMYQGARAPSKMRNSLPALTLGSTWTGDGTPRYLNLMDHRDQVAISDLNGRSCFAMPMMDLLRDKTVLLLTDRKLTSVLAAIDLDGVTKRILLGTPNLVPHLSAIF